MDRMNRPYVQIEAEILRAVKEDLQEGRKA